MSIAPEYIRYLDSWEHTVPVRKLAEQPEAPDLIALRHDVDYDLNLALELAHAEHERGIRATYYLLHTAEYWQDPLLIEKCLQLQDFGHEVGLHNNLLTEWWTETCDDLSQRLTELLAPLRAGGVDIVGLASHGDRRCYEKQYNNSWLFSELRPDRPADTLDGLSAEGIPAEDGGRTVRYPADHKLHRDDGDTLALWTLPLSEFGLTYDASFVNYDRYFTDSGGMWKRSPDPHDVDLSTGRSQILTHPIYWRGPQRIYFFLSTARSGSKWLATMLDQATNLESRHEFSLNHRYDGKTLTPEKHTAAGFTQMQKNARQVQSLLLETSDWVLELPRDYSECNIYLESVLTQLREVFPHAVMIHLHRSPADVIRSLMNRGWYDTPEDDRHPPVPWKGNAATRQFEQCCRYVAAVHERLMALNLPRLSFERMTANPDYLTQQLADYEIGVWPRLLSHEHSRRINVNHTSNFGTFETWPPELRQMYTEICGRIAKELGYHEPAMDARHFSEPGLRDRIVRWFRSARQWGRSRMLSLWRRQRVLKQLNARSATPSSLGTIQNGAIEPTPDGLRFEPHSDRHMSVTIGEGDWAKCGLRGGWANRHGTYVRGEITAAIPENSSGTAQVFALYYDATGKLLRQKCVAFLRAESPECTFAFRPFHKARRFNIALYLPRESRPEHFCLKSIQIERIPLQ